jgi:hypothetical protein
MKTKKSSKLTTLALAGTMLFGIGGCGQNPEYYFNREIEGEQVRFIENSLHGSNHRLKVTKEDGDIIWYVDEDGDFKIEYVDINGVRFYGFSENEDVVRIVEEAQSQFDAYLAKIFEINSSPLRR